jgi:hypothetical protein
VNQAKAGNTTAIIFWLKTRARWREQGAAQGPPSAADGRPHVENLLLPDNTRDPELTKALREAQEKHFAAKRQRQQLQ